MEYHAESWRRTTAISSLVERRRALRTVVPRHSDHLLYVDHIETDGELGNACFSWYANATWRASWPSTGKVDTLRGWLSRVGEDQELRYTQLIGRDELFERRYEADGAPDFEWDVCDQACAAANG